MDEFRIFDSRASIRLNAARVAETIHQSEREHALAILAELMDKLGSDDELIIVRDNTNSPYIWTATLKKADDDNKAK